MFPLPTACAFLGGVTGETSKYTTLRSFVKFWETLTILTHSLPTFIILFVFTKIIHYEKPWPCLAVDRASLAKERPAPHLYQHSRGR